MSMKINIFRSLVFLAVISYTLSVLAKETSGTRADNHNFTGGYIVESSYTPTGGEASVESYPLVIDNKNVVTKFGTYNLSNMYGLEITGKVSGNTFTFTSSLGLLVLDATPNGHYVVLNGGTEDEKFSATPVVFSFDPESDQYSLTDWSVWDYDPQTNKYVKLGGCQVLGVAVDETIVSDKIDFIGEYVVTGYKSEITDGIASEPELAQFSMIIQDDGDGGYEFPQIAGYEVGKTQRGWLGVFGIANGNVLEIQGDNINSASSGLKIACPNTTFNPNYIVSVVFDDSDSGSISDFGIWTTRNGQAKDLITVWTDLTFVTGELGGVESIMKDKEFNQDEPAIYYDLQGIRINNPSKGFYIVKKGNKTRKVYIN